MRRFHPLCLGLAAIVSACSYAPPPIRVYGSPNEIDRLAGRWVGEYHGEPSHPRSGSIAFQLDAGTHEAAGDVLMTPAGGAPYERYDGDELSAPRGGQRAAPARVLTIRFADVERGRVSGRLDNFWDPDHRTSAYTLFTGRVADDRIEGTFTTVYANGDASTTGWWRVQRVRRTERN